MAETADTFLDRKTFFLLSINFRTEFQTGLIFFIHGGRGEYVFIQMENGRIVAELSCEEGQYVFRVTHDSNVENVCDGEWHNVEVLLNLRFLAMRVDLGHYYVSDVTAPENERVFIQATENPMFGGIKPGSDAAKYIEEMNLSRLTRSKMKIFSSRLNFFRKFHQTKLFQLAVMSLLLSNYLIYSI